MRRARVFPLLSVVVIIPTMILKVMLEWGLKRGGASCRLLAGRILERADCRPAAVHQELHLVACGLDVDGELAIIDVRMPPTYTDEGLRAAQSVRRDHPSVGVLVFSQYIETR